MREAYKSYLTKPKLADRWTELQSFLYCLKLTFTVIAFISIHTLASVAIIFWDTSSSVFTRIWNAVLSSCNERKKSCRNKLNGVKPQKIISLYYNSIFFTYFDSGDQSILARTRSHTKNQLGHKCHHFCTDSGDTHFLQHGRTPK